MENLYILPFMKQILHGLILAGILLSGCSEKKPAKPGQTNASPTNAQAVGQNPLNAPADYLGVLGKAQRTAVKTVDAASINQAIMLFHESEDRWPKDLNELVTKNYYPKLPEPPTGMKFYYNPQTGQFKIISQ